MTAFWLGGILLPGEEVLPALETQINFSKKYQYRVFQPQPIASLTFGETASPLHMDERL